MDARLINGDLEAKLVILGSQGVGKTSLLSRYIHNAFNADQRSTVGANFLTKRIISPDTNPPTSLKMQIWDTAGQERFKAISKLYYRGADAAVLCYDITSEKSFEEMAVWLEELRKNEGQHCLIHVVGTKADVVADDPSRREVPFERCIQYVSEQLLGTLQGAQASEQPQRALSVGTLTPQSPGTDARSSGFWNFDIGWDSCHEISAKDGDGVEEVFRVLTRKLIEQRKQQAGALKSEKPQVSIEDEGLDYFDKRNGKGYLRLSDKRRGWLSFPNTPGIRTPGVPFVGGETENASNRCC